MNIEFREMDFDGETHCSPVVDGKKYNVFFLTKGEALIYAGLAMSELSVNDCNHISNYMTAMINGIKGEK